MADQAVVAVIRASSLWSGGATPKMYSNCDLVIENGVVAAIEDNYRGRVDHEIDGGGCLVVPGLVNCHTHAGCTPHARGVSEDLTMLDEGAFYHSLIPLLGLGYSELSNEEFAAVMEWDLIAMLLGGATMVVEENFGGADIWMDLVERLGLRSNLGLTYPGNVGSIGYVKEGKIVIDDPGDVEAGMQAGLKLHDEHHGAFNDRLRIHLSPHAPDTVPEEVLRETKKQIQERGITAHLHLAQHLSENRTIAEKHGNKTSVQYLDDIGFLGPDILATHVSYVTENDMDIIARSKTNVIHASYRKAKEGLNSPYWQFIERGANVAIATDSFSHDLIEDLRLGALLGKISQGKVGTPRAEDLISSATRGAAIALERDDLGHLNPGARGDAIVVDISTPFNSPVFDPLRALVYYSTGANVRHSVVDGIPVVRDHKVVGSDMAAVRKKAEAACRRIWELAAEQGALPEGVTYSG
jgi:5-methylthioadenosine/S-adenosylhomocysteine deaminase